MTSEDDNSAHSGGSDSENSPSPKGGKVTRQFLHHGVSSKARTTEIVKSINHIGAHIIELDAVVNHVANNVHTHTTTTSASISSLLESQNALSQRLTTLEVN